MCGCVGPWVNRTMPGKRFGPSRWAELQLCYINIRLFGYLPQPSKCVTIPSFCVLASSCREILEYILIQIKPKPYCRKFSQLSIHLAQIHTTKCILICSSSWCPLNLLHLSTPLLLQFSSLKSYSGRQERTIC